LRFSFRVQGFHFFCSICISLFDRIRRKIWMESFSIIRFVQLHMTHIQIIIVTYVFSYTNIVKTNFPFLLKLLETVEKWLGNWVETEGWGEFHSLFNRNTWIYHQSLYIPLNFQSHCLDTPSQSFSSNLPFSSRYCLFDRINNFFSKSIFPSTFRTLYLCDRWSVYFKHFSTPNISQFPNSQSIDQSMDHFSNNFHSHRKKTITFCNDQ
jgi:hypothetical protein